METYANKSDLGDLYTEIKLKFKRLKKLRNITLLSFLILYGYFFISIYFAIAIKTNLIYIFLIPLIASLIFLIYGMYKLLKIKISIKEKLILYLSDAVSNLQLYHSDKDERYYRDFVKNTDKIKDLTDFSSRPKLGFSFESKFYDGLNNLSNSIVSYQNNLEIHNKDKIIKRIHMFNTLIISLANDNITEFFKTTEENKQFQENRIKTFLSRIPKEIGYKETISWIIAITLVLIAIIILVSVFKIPIDKNITTILTTIILSGTIARFSQSIITKIINFIIG